MIYSKEVVEFVTVSAEYVRFVENLEKTEKNSLLEVSQKLFPLLYIKAALLPQIEPVEEDALEKHVTEMDWNYVKNSVSKILGDHDIWMKINEPLMPLEDEGMEICVSECYADIFQDLSDFLLAYRIGSESIMTDALFVVKENFEQFWGTRLLAASNAIHQLMYGRELDEDISE